MNDIFCIIRRRFVHLNWDLITIAYAAGGTFYTFEVDVYNHISLLPVHSRLSAAGYFIPLSLWANE